MHPGKDPASKLKAKSEHFCSSFPEMRREKRFRLSMGYAPSDPDPQPCKQQEDESDRDLLSSHCKCLLSNYACRPIAAICHQEVSLSVTALLCASFCSDRSPQGNDFQLRISFPLPRTRISSRTTLAASVRLRSCCSPVFMFFREIFPWAISSSPRKATKGMPSLSA